MNFASDNTTGAAPQVMAAIQAANAGRTMPYGNDAASRRAEARIAEVFECEADVFMVATGTASNALGLAAMTPPFGAVLCHADSHIEQHECGAPEFYTGGAKLILLDGPRRKLHLDDVRRRQHALQPALHEWGSVARSLGDSGHHRPGLGSVCATQQIAPERLRSSTRAQGCAPSLTPGCLQSAARLHP